MMDPTNWYVTVILNQINHVLFQWVELYVRENKYFKNSAIWLKYRATVKKYQGSIPSDDRSF